MFWQQKPQPYFRRSQPCSATCFFNRAIAMAIRSANCRSSARLTCLSRIKCLIRSLASMYSLSSLACSVHPIASLAAVHITHLLKTSTATLRLWRTKSKYYFCLSFALGPRSRPLDGDCWLRWRFLPQHCGRQQRDHQPDGKWLDERHHRVEKGILVHDTQFIEFFGFLLNRGGRSP